MMQVVVTAEAIRHVKLQSERRNHKSTQLFQAGCQSCHPTNSVKALKGKTVSFHRLAHLGVSLIT